MKDDTKHETQKNEGCKNNAQMTLCLHSLHFQRCVMIWCMDFFMDFLWIFLWILLWIFYGFFMDFFMDFFVDFPMDFFPS